MRILQPLPEPLELFDVENSPIPINPNEKLKPFQDREIRNVLRFYKNLGMKGAYNADDVGTGKSLQAIAIGHVLEAKQVLIICPAVVRDSWEEQIRQFSIKKNPSIKTYYSAKNAGGERSEAQYTIVSYNLLLSLAVYESLVKRGRWDLIIVDEAHNISSLRAKRSKLTISLWNQADRGLLLSATPIRRCTIDLFPGCHIIMPETFPSLIDFAEEYAHRRPVPWGNGVEYYGGKNLEQLSGIIRSNFYTRVTKAEVIEDLPPKTYQRIHVDIDEMENDLSPSETEIVMRALEESREVGPKTTMAQRKHIALVRRELALKKLTASAEFISDFLEGQIPVMVVFYHREIGDALATAFHNYTPAKIDGGTSIQNKNKAIHDFNEGQTNMLLIQISCAVGINLQKRCSTCVFVETSYSPAEVEQAIGRLDRIGQKNAVTAYFLCAKGNEVDKRVLDIIIKKQRVIDEVIVSTHENSQPTVEQEVQ